MLIHSGKLEAMRIGPRILRISTEALEAHKSKLDAPQAEIEPPVKEIEQGISNGRVFVKLHMSWNVESSPRNRVVERMKQIALLERTITFVRLEQHRADLEDGLQVDPYRYGKICEVAGRVMRLDTRSGITAGAHDVMRSYEHAKATKFEVEAVLDFSSDVRALIDAITDLIGERSP